MKVKSAGSSRKLNLKCKKEHKKPAGRGTFIPVPCRHFQFSVKLFAVCADHILIPVIGILFNTGKIF